MRWGFEKVWVLYGSRAEIQILKYKEVSISFFFAWYRVLWKFPISIIGGTKGATAFKFVVI